MEHESDGDNSCIWCSWNNLQSIGKGTARLRPGDLRTLALTQNLAKDHKLSAV